ncbi:MAG: peptidoglycan D,D-transpeptidase FtsI family protein [Sporichthyaceae bacterium]
MSGAVRPARPPRPRKPRKSPAQVTAARLGDPRRRLYAATTILCLVAALMVGRLVQVQAFEAAGFASLAQNERLQTVAVNAVRGQILDRDGDVLARSVEARTVTADPTLISDPARYANLLAPKLGIDEATLTRKLADRPRRYVVLARNVDPQAWRAIRETVDPGTNKAISGVFGVVTSKRMYPADDLAANVLGFINASGAAGGGLERVLDDLLAGTDGKQTYERSSRGGRIATAGITVVDPIPGADVQLTIDRDIQYVAQRAIAQKVAQTRAKSGTVIVQDTRTGEILAMATAPTFDPNDPGTGLDINRGNRALSEIYEPGSIAKALPLAALLEEGVVTPKSQFSVPGQLRRAGHVLNDHDKHGLIRLTLAGIMAKSSNIGTVLAADRVSAPVLHRYLKLFGIASPTGLAWPGESRGLLASGKDWSPTQRYTIPFGQGFALNTVQAASVFSTIGNGGVRVVPSLIRSWTDANGRRHVPEPAATTRVVSERTAKATARLLETVTAPGGTASHVQIPGYRIAGKTGTAQFANSRCKCYRGYTASFAGFAPADDPALTVSVTLQRPERGHFGGLLGGPVFTEVMSFALRSLGIAPTGVSAKRLRLDW